MATIAVVPFHWAGNLNASFGLARKLARRGHRIHYACLPDTEARIRAQGFGFSPILADLYPAGSLEKEAAADASGKGPSVKEREAQSLGTLRAAAEGELDRVAAEVKPDLWLISNSVPWAGIAAHRTRVPVALYSSNLISPYDPQVPPLWTGIVPGQGALWKLRTSAIWRFFFTMRKVASLVWNEEKQLRDLARACDYPQERLDFRTESFPRLGLPEVILCPDAFDFPRTAPPAHAHFVEPSIDLDRKDAPFDWTQVPEGKPLVYAAVGSMASTMHPQSAKRFLAAFLAAMADRPELFAVVATGKHIDRAGFTWPANVLAVQEAPQLALLKKAALMVSHGGLNSLKEAIAFGVPLVVVPMFFDHFGYAARVVYHRLGERVPLGKLDGKRLGEAMDAVRKDPEIAGRVREMAKRFTALEEAAPSVAVLEGLLPKA